MCDSITSIIEYSAGEFEGRGSKQDTVIKKYLFNTSADQNEFLPVYPGIAYPGIMALEKNRIIIKVKF